MRRNRDSDDGIGQDAFLDTTANLVGILIILVVVVGTKTKIDAEEYSRRAAETQAASDLDAPRAEAQALAEALVRHQRTMVEYELETEYRRAERDALLERVQLARQSLQERLAAASAEQQRRVAEAQRIEELRSELNKKLEQLGVDDERPRPKIVLEHLPTPMARTVFTREVHLQIKGNRVTLIPWERLVEMLRRQAPLAAGRHAARGEIADTLGPVGGFLMHFHMVPIPGGLELDRFELEPLPDAPAETLEEALGTAGRLQIELATRDPAETVVTAWVYPDSFETFRKLKARLFEQGFLTAARPLPWDVRIGASPHGTRSAAQ
ncbi:MAG: hypothetical protein D6753_12900 [Planctomycetota bacterium]|nr:MAG: hypothetical protein D6753_12900 [Planctomycetota bacterium]